jgi:uncharacterized delta-60 repeat protein
MKTAILILFLTILCAHSIQAQDGTLDHSFNANAVFSGSGFVYDIKKQPDNKYVAAGGFVIISGTDIITGVARINNDGTLDAGFKPAGIPITTFRAVELQSDGKIIVAGQSSTIWRLNHDGTIDNSFNANTSGTGTAGTFVWTTKIQPDGKILVGGSFESLNDISSPRIARLNPDGSIDETFSTGQGASGGRVVDIALQPDGKIIITGDFNRYNGISREKIARLNSDGSLDTSFDPGSGTDFGIEAVLIQPDGKIIIAGNFTKYNNINAGRIARLNADGTLDPSFNTSGSGFNNNELLCLALQDDGKIITGGNSSQFNGNTVPRLVRLNPDGTLDNSFNQGGAGPGAKIWSVNVENNGKIMIGGEFSQYNGNDSRRVGRLNGTATYTSSDKIPETLSFNIYPNPTSSHITISSIPYGSAVQLWDSSGRLLQSYPNPDEKLRLNMQRFENGMYLIRIETQGKVFSKKVILSR